MLVRFSFVLALAMLFVAPLLEADEPADTIKQATTDKKARVHVVIRETVKSKEQKDWTDTYNATIELYVNDQKFTYKAADGTTQDSFRGSTLPNFKPGAHMPEGWKYSVVMASCAFPAPLKGRVYTWTRGLRSDGQTPCLRLAAKVPTVAVASERFMTMHLADIIKAVIDEAVAARYQFAENILIHTGSKLDWRGSAGCLTVHPDDAAKFFAAIPDKTKGTLELNRGIEDEEQQKSYCY